MATSASEARAALVALTDLSRRELADLWQELSRLPPQGIRDALIELLPAIVEEYGYAAGALAADWYDDLRDEADTKRAFRAEPSDLPDRGRTDALARWGVEPLFGASPDGAAALTLIGGGLQRIIANAHRLTIVDNSIRDPDATGWRRVGVGKNCGFCRMLIDRGAVYTERSVTFRSHDHCNCAASPEWADNVVKVSREPFRQSQRNRSDETKAADNARARKYVADRYGDA